MSESELRASLPAMSNAELCGLLRGEEFWSEVATERALMREALSRVIPMDGSQADFSGQGRYQKSPEPSGSELVSSIAIDENPKRLRLQCSCGQSIELIHTQSQEGIRLSLSQSAEQTSETSPLRMRRVGSEELGNALFGDGSSVPSMPIQPEEVKPDASKALNPQTTRKPLDARACRDA